MMVIKKTFCFLNCFNVCVWFYNFKYIYIYIYIYIYVLKLMRNNIHRIESKREDEN